MSISDVEMIEQLGRAGVISKDLADELQVKLARLRDSVQILQRVSRVRLKLDDLVRRENIIDCMLPAAMARLGVITGQRVWNEVRNKYPGLKGFKADLRAMRTMLEKDEPAQIADLVCQDGSLRLQIWLE